MDTSSKRRLTIMAICRRLSSTSIKSQRPLIHAVLAYHWLRMNDGSSWPKRAIVDFYLDEEDHWVAELECGHGRHVRHDPPWQNRPWVIKAETREPYLGYEFICKKCLPIESD